MTEPHLHTRAALPQAQGQAVLPQAILDQATLGGGTSNVGGVAAPAPAPRRKLAVMVGGLLLVAAIVVAVSVQPRLDPVPVVVQPPQAQVPIVPVEPAVQATQAPFVGAIREPGTEGRHTGMFGIWVAPTSVPGQTIGRIVDAGQAVVQQAGAQRLGLKVVGFLRPDTRTVAESLFGLANGDVILSYDGVAVTSIDALNALHLAHQAGDEVTLLVLRAGAGVEQVLHGKLGRVTALGAL